MFEEIGEVRTPVNSYELSEWVRVGGRPANVCELHYPKKEYPILKLTEYPINPLEPIVEAADRLKSPATERIRLLIAEGAISKAMAIVEGGKP